MTSCALHECLIYPGEYTPLPETAAALDQHAAGTSANPVAPAMNINEWPDSFSFEMVMPGIKRENIIVHSHGNILSVIVVPQQKGGHTGEKQLVHEFEKGLQERHIILPENADPEFVSAEYNLGVLKLYIPKSTGTPNPCNRQIIVY